MPSQSRCGECVRSKNKWLKHREKDWIRPRGKVERVDFTTPIESATKMIVPFSSTPMSCSIGHRKNMAAAAAKDMLRYSYSPADLRRTIRPIGKSFAQHKSARQFSRGNNLSPCHLALSRPLPSWAAPACRPCCIHTHTMQRMMSWKGNIAEEGMAGACGIPSDQKGRLPKTTTSRNVPPPTAVMVPSTMLPRRSIPTLREWRHCQELDQRNDSRQRGRLAVGLQEWLRAHLAAVMLPVAANTTVPK